MSSQRRPSLPTPASFELEGGQDNTMHNVLNEIRDETKVSNAEIKKLLMTSVVIMKALLAQRRDIHDANEKISMLTNLFNARILKQDNFELQKEISGLKAEVLALRDRKVEVDNEAQKVISEGISLDGNEEFNNALANLAKLMFQL